MDTLATIVVLLIAAIVPVWLALRLFPIEHRSYIRSYLRGYFGQDADLRRIERMLEGASKEELVRAKQVMEEYCSRVDGAQTLHGLDERLERCFK